MMETFSLTPEEIHAEINKWPAYIRECPTFWHEPTILDKTIPVLAAAINDVAISFLLKSPDYQ